MKDLTLKNNKIMFLVVLLIKLFVLMINLLSEFLFIEFIKAILKEYTYCRKVMNKHLNKNVIMSEEE